MSIKNEVLIVIGLLALAIAVSCQGFGGPENAAQMALGEYASREGMPYKNVRIQTLSNDGAFATVRITAEFKETAQADWVEKQAEVQFRNIGGKWQVSSPIISFESIFPGDQDWVAVNELAKASPADRGGLMTLFEGSQKNMEWVLEGGNEETLKAIITDQRFNPRDEFSSDELARAYGWTRALRKRFFSDGKFDEKSFYDYLTKALGYSPSSVTQFLTKYEAFLKFEGIGISRGQ